jgi:heptosyltransferase-2
VAYDCRYFQGDRPCVWHKRETKLCECEQYEPIGRRILIIKLDAMGDVLRTTCILPGLKNRWPQSAITWITDPASVPLLRNNPYVHEIIPYGPDALLQLSIRKFDAVISLDAGRTCAALAALAQADEKSASSSTRGDLSRPPIPPPKSGCN